jgi:RNA polymerase sigma factor (sigma-70 family)
MTDAKLQINQILAGNRKAFQVFVDEYKRLVSHVVFRMVPNSADQEDVCQEVFLKIYQNLSGFRSESKISTWVAAVAYNTCLNHLEKKRIPLLDDLLPEEKSVDSIPDCVVGPDKLVEERETSSILQAQIGRIPVRFRTILTLYHLEGISYKEIGEITGLPEGTVKSYLFRARRLLKDRLMAKYQPEDLWH